MPTARRRVGPSLITSALSLLAMSWLRNAFGTSAGTLSIACERVLFVTFLRTPDGVRPPATLSGSVTLSLSRPIQCSELVVSLEGRAHLRRTADGDVTTSSTLDCSVSIAIGPELDAGAHTFPFAIEFARTTAPSDECGSLARIVHTVHARAPSLKLAVARPIVLVPIPHEQTEPPRSAEVAIRGTDAEMGSYEYVVIGNVSVVGGLIAFDLRLRSGFALGDPRRPIFRASMQLARAHSAERTAAFVRQVVTITPPSGDPHVHETMHQLWQTALSPAREPIPSESWLRATSGFPGSDEAPSRIRFEKHIGCA